MKNPFKPGDVVRALDTYGSGIWFKRGDLLVVQPPLKAYNSATYVTILSVNDSTTGRIVKKGNSGEFYPWHFELVSSAVASDEGRSEREAAAKRLRAAAKEWGNAEKEAKKLELQFSVLPHIVLSAGISYKKGLEEKY